MFLRTDSFSHMVTYVTSSSVPHDTPYHLAVLNVLHFSQTNFLAALLQLRRYSKVFFAPSFEQQKQDSPEL
jgi:hypothetical protein